jgi:lysophospholipase L1-like esterase
MPGSPSARARKRALFAVVALAMSGLLAPARSLAAPAAWIAKTEPIRIMALGDSITAGVGPNGRDVDGDGGYRGELERLLEAGGYRFVMTGTRTDYSERIAARAHEGWPGYVLRSLPSAPGHELVGPVTARAIRTYEPDVVLLMAGTNDLLRLQKGAAGYTIPEIVDGMDALLAQIVALEPHVHVIVAGVVQSPKISACAVAAFDGAERAGCEPAGDDAPSLRSLVARYRTAGYDVSFAPGMSAAVPRDGEHFPDGIHPTGAGGYAAIARVWMRAIESETLPGPGGVADARD